jgi:hypothetical protein
MSWPLLAACYQLEFKPETPTATISGGAVHAAPASLGVLIDFQLAGGGSHRITVNVLHTALAQEGL